jgi:hypothetical protein
LEIEAGAEIVQPELNTTISVRASHQIMTSALDNQTNILVSRKFQRVSNVIDVGGIDSKSWIWSKCTGYWVLSSSEIDRRASDVPRMSQAKWLRCLKCLNSPVGVDIVALCPILFWTRVARLGKWRRLANLIVYKLIKRIPYSLQRPTAVFWAL